jgi:hypothetical protein
MNAFLVCAPSGLGSATANQYREGIQIMGTGSCEKGLRGGLSRMKGNFQVRFLGEAVAAMPLPYPTGVVKFPRSEERTTPAPDRATPSYSRRGKSNVPCWFYPLLG